MVSPTAVAPSITVLPTAAAVAEVAAAPLRELMAVPVEASTPKVEAALTAKGIAERLTTPETVLFATCFKIFSPIYPP
jgi:hypothetical protein